MTSLPEWIDPEAWSGFVAMRKKIKKPMTDRAEMLILKALYEFKAQGHDPNVVLDTSTVNCWAGVFAPKAQPGRTNVGEYQAPPKMTPEEFEASKAAKEAAMARLGRARPRRTMQ